MNLSKLDHVDVWVRTLKTGATVFVATLVGSLVNLASLPTLSVVKKLVVAALSAAGTAILNYVLQLLKA